MLPRPCTQKTFHRWVLCAWVSIDGLQMLTVTKSEPKKTDATPSMPNRRCASGESIASRAFLNSDTPDCRPARVFSWQRRVAHEQQTMMVHI